MTSALRRSFAAGVALALLGLGGCTDATEPTSSETQPTPSEATPSQPSPTEDPSESPSETPAEPSSDGTAVPLYWVTDSGAGPRLVREFERVPGDPLTEAARLVMGGGQPDDPDYRTLWPQVEIDSVEATDGLLLVTIPGDGFTERPDGMRRREARLAVQQLVRTLQGVQQARVPVQIERTGGPATLFGLPTDSPFREGKVLRTLNHVNITSPEEGASVTGGSLTVTGVANSFEASGPCRLLVGEQEVALEPYQTDGWMEDRLFPFEVELPLGGVTGEAVVRCETDDPTGGTEGFGPFVDTKTITVTR
jgi:hypothetical protein